MNTFLDANEWMAKDQMFVDDYSFDAYKAAGFGRFDQVDKEAAKQVKMTAPELGFGEWITYFTTVGKVSPIPKVCLRLWLNCLRLSFLDHGRIPNNNSVFAGYEIW